MPSRCVVYGCSNVPDIENEIVLHKIPYDQDVRPEAIKRRKRWVDFVKRKRANWEPTNSSCICSRHFAPDAFEKNGQFAWTGEDVQTIAQTRRNRNYGISNCVCC